MVSRYPYEDLLQTSIRYDYINSFILDYIAFSIHVSEVGGFYWYIIALQVCRRATRLISYFNLDHKSLLAMLPYCCNGHTDSNVCILIQHTIDISRLNTADINNFKTCDTWDNRLQTLLDFTQLIFDFSRFFTAPSRHFKTFYSCQPILDFIYYNKRHLQKQQIKK